MRRLVVGIAAVNFTHFSCPLSTSGLNVRTCVTGVWRDLKVERCLILGKSEPGSKQICKMGYIVQTSRCFPSCRACVLLCRFSQLNLVSFICRSTRGTWANWIISLRSSDAFICLMGFVCIGRDGGTHDWAITAGHFHVAWKLNPAQKNPCVLPDNSGSEAFILIPWRNVAHWTNTRIESR